MTTPVKNFGDFTVCFEAQAEDVSMRQHFVNECGWTAREYNRIKDFAWFTACVTIWKDGVQLAEEYLGACCYKEASEFYTTYAGDYFCDKVYTMAKEIKDESLLKAVNEWRDALRKDEEIKNATT